MEDPRILTAIGRADQIVEPMPDSPKKIAAFQVVLAHLLRESQTTLPRARSGNKRRSGVRPNGTRSRLLTLIEDGAFREARSLGETRRILSERGWQYRAEDLGTPLTRLVQQGHLRRAAVAQGGKKIWKYSTN